MFYYLRETLFMVNFRSLKYIQVIERLTRCLRLLFHFLYESTFPTSNNESVMSCARIRICVCTHTLPWKHLVYIFPDSIPSNLLHNFRVFVNIMVHVQKFYFIGLQITLFSTVITLECKSSEINCSFYFTTFWGRKFVYGCFLCMHISEITV